MKINGKNLVIMVLSIVIVCTLVFSAYSYIGFQSYMQEQEIEEQVDNAYVMGVQDGVASTLSNILSQLNSKGYVILNIDTGNGTQTIYLQQVVPI